MRRFKYYQQDPVFSNKKIAKPYQTLDTNLREKHDSFFLRHQKEIVTGTNHSPNHSQVFNTSPKYNVPKGAFKRFIGDVRDEDFSLPLPEKCNHRCARANNVEIKK